MSLSLFVMASLLLAQSPIQQFSTKKLLPSSYEIAYVLKKGTLTKSQQQLLKSLKKEENSKNAFFTPSLVYEFIKTNAGYQETIEDFKNNLDQVSNKKKIKETKPSGSSKKIYESFEKWTTSSNFKMPYSLYSYAQKYLKKNLNNNEVITNLAKTWKTKFPLLWNTKFDEYVSKEKNNIVSSTLKESDEDLSYLYSQWIDKIIKNFNNLANEDLLKLKTLKGYNTKTLQKFLSSPASDDMYDKWISEYGLGHVLDKLKEKNIWDNDDSSSLVLELKNKKINWDFLDTFKNKNDNQLLSSWKKLDSYYNKQQDYYNHQQNSYFLLQYFKDINEESTPEQKKDYVKKIESTTSNKGLKIPIIKDLYDEWKFKKMDEVNDLKLSKQYREDLLSWFKEKIKKEKYYLAAIKGIANKIFKKDIFQKLLKETYPDWQSDKSWKKSLLQKEGSKKEVSIDLYDKNNIEKFFKWIESAIKKPDKKNLPLRKALDIEIIDINVAKIYIDSFDNSKYVKENYLTLSEDYSKEILLWFKENKQRYSKAIRWISNKIFRKPNFQDFLKKAHPGWQNDKSWKRYVSEIKFNKRKIDLWNKENVKKFFKWLESEIKKPNFNTSKLKTALDIELANNIKTKKIYIKYFDSSQEAYNMFKKSYLSKELFLAKNNMVKQQSDLYLTNYYMDSQEFSQIQNDFQKWFINKYLNSNTKEKYIQSLKDRINNDAVKDILKTYVEKNINDRNDYLKILDAMSIDKSKINSYIDKITNSSFNKTNWVNNVLIPKILETRNYDNFLNKYLFKDENILLKNKFDILLINDYFYKINFNTFKKNIETYSKIFSRHFAPEHDVNHVSDFFISPMDYNEKQKKWFLYKFFEHVPETYYADALNYIFIQHFLDVVKDRDDATYKLFQDDDFYNEWKTTFSYQSKKWEWALKKYIQNTFLRSQKFLPLLKEIYDESNEKSLFIVPIINKYNEVKNKDTLDFANWFISNNHLFSDDIINTFRLGVIDFYVDKINDEKLLKFSDFTKELNYYDNKYFIANQETFLKDFRLWLNSKIQDSSFNNWKLKPKLVDKLKQSRNPWSKKLVFTSAKDLPAIKEFYDKKVYNHKQEGKWTTKSFVNILFLSNLENEYKKDVVNKYKQNVVNKYLADHYIKPKNYSIIQLNFEWWIENDFKKTIIKKHFGSIGRTKEETKNYINELKTIVKNNSEYIKNPILQAIHDKKNVDFIFIQDHQIKKDLDKYLIGYHIENVKGYSNKQYVKSIIISWLKNKKLDNSKPFKIKDNFFKRFSDFFEVSKQDFYEDDKDYKHRLKESHDYVEIIKNYISKNLENLKSSNILELLQEIRRNKNYSQLLSLLTKDFKVFLNEILLNLELEQNQSFKNYLSKKYQNSNQFINWLKDQVSKEKIPKFIYNWYINNKQNLLKQNYQKYLKNS